MSKPHGVFWRLLVLTVGVASVVDSMALEAQQATPTLPAESEPGISQQQRVYKTVGAKDLLMYLTLPPSWRATDQRPVIVFFFGGGWTDRYLGQFAFQANYFASRGMVAARADYRVKSQDQVTPDECVKDARAAVRWIRKNAGSLGVDPNRLIVSGGSAGGLLAACQCIKESVDHAEDDLSISTMPQAMVLYNPALDFMFEDLVARVHGDQELAKKISPTWHMDKRTPPALLFYGSEDSRAKRHWDAYARKAKVLGLRAEFFVAEGEQHGFFNLSPWRDRTTIAADRFLMSLGFLAGEPTLSRP